MQAMKIRQVAFQRLLILFVVVAGLVGAILFAAFSSDTRQSTDHEPQIIERSAPVSWPRERSRGFPHNQSGPADNVHRPTDRP
jgi:hypothetical protein